MNIVNIQNLKIGNNFYHISSDDIYAQHLGNEFEPFTCQLIDCFSTNGCCIDVGANIGMTSLLMSSLFNDVYSFEPAPSTFSLLKKNIENNNIQNIQLFNIGLGSEVFSTEIQFAEGNRSGGFINNITKASEGHVTENIRVEVGDAILEQHHLLPSFIKIDVEGYELHTLRGLKNTISASNPIVMLEANHWCLNAFQRTSMPDFVDELIDIFPILYAVHGDKYLDLRNQSDRYVFLYSNILRNEYLDVLGGFAPSQFDKFSSRYRK
uniref:FkbM family methyltransferase n=1 Tax=Orrella sp. TaxID=1921583 RepID=UPI00404729D4